MEYCSRFFRVWFCFVLMLPGALMAADAPQIAVGEMARIVAGLQPDPAGFDPAARALFPAFARDVTAQLAGRYVMVAMQRAGLPPSLERQSPNELKRTLSAYRDRWRFFARTGFYRTNDLEDFASRREVLVSVTSQLMAFASRLGYEVEAVEPVQIAADGKDLVRVTGDITNVAAWNSVRLTLNKNGRHVIIDYIRMDLSDGVIVKHPSHKAFIEQASANRTLVKAASHLLQRPYFTILRNDILKNAPSVIQDETGIEYSALAGAFKTRLYGSFVKPHNLFQTSMQTSLAKAYQEARDVRPLTFRLGYDKTAGSSVVVAGRGGVAVPPPRNCAAQ